MGDKYKHLRKEIHKEKLIKKGCTDKKAFETKEEALCKNQEVYKCRICGKFHRTTNLFKLIRSVRR